MLLCIENNINTSAKQVRCCDGHRPYGHCTCDYSCPNMLPAADVAVIGVDPGGAGIKSARFIYSSGRVSYAPQCVQREHCLTFNVLRIPRENSHHTPSHPVLLCVYLLTDTKVFLS
jgi:hypothetical protein